MAELEKLVAGLASEIHTAIITARNPALPPEVHASAALKLKEIKNDAQSVDVLLQALFRLVNNAEATRRSALKMLRDVVRTRWEELGTFTQQFLHNVPQLVQNSCSEWDTKSEIAELIAEVARKCLNDPSSFDHLAGFVTLEQDEVLGMIFKYLQDDITVDTDYLKGGSRVSLLHRLTGLAPRIIELLISVFMKHVDARHDMTVAWSVQPPNAAVVSILSALTGYATWAPITDRNWSLVIYRCVMWLSTYNSVPACRFLQVIVCRSQPIDSTKGMVMEFLTTLLNISQGFTSGSKLLLKSDCEFTKCICDTMAALGCSKVQSVLDNKDWIQNYLQEMLHYYQHQRIELQSKSLSFWLVALQESLPTEMENRRIASCIPETMYGELLDISVKNMLKKGAVLYLGPSGPSNKGFQRESDFSDHPTKLLDLMKVVASERPVIAAEFVTKTFSDLFPNVKRGVICPEDLQTIGNTLDCLEQIVDGIFGDASYRNNQNETSKEQIRFKFEVLLAEIVNLDLSETWAIELHGRFLSLFGLYCKNYPKEISSVVDKLLSLLISLPAENNLPSDSNEARFTICTLLIDVSQVACDAFALEKDRVVGILANFQNEGKLLDGEYEDLRRQLVLDVMQVN